MEYVFDLVRKKIFIKNKKKPEIYADLESFYTGLQDVFLAPIKESNPFNVWEK